MPGVSSTIGPMTTGIGSMRYVRNWRISSLMILEARFDIERESGEAAEGRTAYREKRKPNGCPES